MRGFFLAVFVAIIGTCSFGQGARAEQRYAFVVGIDNYDNLERPLQKARNDATAVADSFKNLGFQVTLGLDLDQAQLLENWDKFISCLKPNDLAAVFFAGHGVQIAGLNYLLPRDILSADKGEEVLKGRAVALAKMMDDLADRKARVSLLIIDACRDNPFKKPGRRSIGGERGLAPVEARPFDSAHGTFVMYSAGAGETALDRLSDSDPNPNSVYTRRLLPLFVQPGLSLLQIAKRVQSEVEAEAKTVTHPQTPAYYDGISGEYYLLASEKLLTTSPVVNEPTLPRASVSSVFPGGIRSSDVVPDGPDACSSDNPPISCLWSNK